MNADTTAASTAPHWQRGRFARWIFATDHKRVGIVWLALGGVGLLLGGILAAVAALQTARPDGSVVGAGAFASLTTMQGTLLSYGGVLPLALGLAVAVLPLQLGARGLALPTFASAGLWFGISGVTAVVLSSFASGDAPRSSWTTNPLAALEAGRPGESVRLMGLLLIALGALLTAVSLVATLRGERAPGLTSDRLPPFAQSVGVLAVALLVLAPVSLLGTLLLLLARANPGSFDWYVTENGLLRGYGWVFDQGIVAITLVLALGVAAELVATFSRGAFGARRIVALGLVATAVLVAIVPSADQVDARTWAAVLALVAVAPAAALAVVLLLAGLPAARREGAGTPLPFALGALVLVLAGALATLLFVVQHGDLRGTTFESARLGLLWSAVLVALLGGAVYWWPKLLGRALDPRLTGLSATLLTLGGLLLGLGWMLAGWNDQPAGTAATTDKAGTGALLAALGVAGLVGGILAFGLAKLTSLRGRRVGNDPWQADTLEWYTTSPPPPHNFDSLPAVASARPLADLRQELRDKGAL